jgi:hypothetical protein
VLRVVPHTRRRSACKLLLPLESEAEARAAACFASFYLAGSVAGAATGLEFAKLGDLGLRQGEDFQTIHVART